MMKQELLNKISGIYAIIDQSLYPDVEPYELVEKTAKAGVNAIQLRLKNIGGGDFLNIARKSIQLTKEAGSLIIVNDRADVALASGSNALHIGQDDIPIPSARKIVGDEFIIGASTHTLEELENALSAGADYVGYGPVFATKSKAGALPPRGVDALRDIVKRSPIPVVAIGGIDAGNIASVRDTGAKAAAVIKALGSKLDIEDSVQELVKIWE